MGAKEVIVMILGIIGGGASGMAAALEASKMPNVRVILFERQARLGKKLLATGNGRCNLSNTNACSGGYHGLNPGFASYALEKMSPEATLEWFSQMGLLTVTESTGRVYPYSDQANSVVDVLRFALDQPNIRLCLGAEVRKLSKAEQGFSVVTDEETVFCDKVIVACGGLAGTKLGGSMAGYKLLSKLGHKSTKLRPALVQLKTGWPGIAALKGVRANCHVEILKDGIHHSESTGEIQFTDYGLSGPVIFETSRDACSSAGTWTAKLDFLPQWDVQQLLRTLSARPSSLTTDDLLTGILHNRLGRVLTKAAGIGQCAVKDLSDDELAAVCRTVKAFEVSLTEPMGMDSAQVTAGGIITDEFDQTTMESRLVPGLYACGEVLDIDGDCGGYNLQWAWSSGILAGRSAGKETL